MISYPELKLTILIHMDYIPIAFNYIEHEAHPIGEFQAVYFNPKGNPGRILQD